MRFTVVYDEGIIEKTRAMEADFLPRVGDLVAINDFRREGYIEGVVTRVKHLLDVTNAQGFATVYVSMLPPPHPNVG